MKKHKQTKCFEKFKIYNQTTSIDEWAEDFDVWTVKTAENMLKYSLKYIQTGINMHATKQLLLLPADHMFRVKC